MVAQYNFKIWKATIIYNDERYSHRRMMMMILMMMMRMRMMRMMMMIRRYRLLRTRSCNC